MYNYVIAKTIKVSCPGLSHVVGVSLFFPASALCARSCRWEASIVKVRYIINLPMDVISLCVPLSLTFCICMLFCGVHYLEVVTSCTHCDPQFAVVFVISS